MAFLRQWLLGVVSCAFLVSLLDQLTPEGSVRKLARFSGGLVLILCMLRPLGTAEPRELALDLDGLSADRAALEEQYRDVSGQSLAAVIAERTGAYIEDKAHALGTEVTAEVTVREEDGAFIPDRAVLFGEENAELSVLLTQELGIAPERQEWRSAVFPWAMHRIQGRQRAAPCCCRIGRRPAARMCAAADRPRGNPRFCSP